MRIRFKVGQFYKYGEGIATELFVITNVIGMYVYYNRINEDARLGDYFGKGSRFARNLKKFKPTPLQRVIYGRK
jgi:hypothetical protein